LSSAYAWSGAPHGTSPGAGHGGRADRVSSQISHGHANMCTGARQRGRNGLRYYSPTGIPSHTAHRIEGRGKKGEQGSQRRLAHSAASDVAFTGASRESSGSGTLGVAVLGQGRSTQFSRPAPSHLAWYPRLSSIHRSQPLCSSEHPPKTPGPIGLSPPKNGRSGLVHPGTDDRQAAPSAEYYYTPRSHTYEQISPERHEYAFHFGRDYLLS
jgi:hypothetical protein